MERTEALLVLILAELRRANMEVQGTRVNMASPIASLLTDLPSLLKEAQATAQGRS